MKLLMLHPHDLHYFPWTIRIIRLGLELVRAGHQVTLGYIEFPLKGTRWEGKKVRERLPEGLEYVALSARARRLLPSLRRFYHERPPFDLVHVQKCFSTMTLPALYLAYGLGLPVHYDWDDNEAGLAEGWIHFRPARWEVKLYELLLPRLVDSMTVASEELRRRAIARGMPPEDIFPAPVGADLEAFSPARDGRGVRERYQLGDHPVVLYMGQLAGAAYVNLLLDAAAFILKRRPQVRFLVVGGGERLKGFQHHARVLQVDRQVIFTDYVPQDEVPEYVAAADIAVATFEDNEITRCKSPLKVAEYMAAGKPIVASRMGEVPRMLEGCALLVPPCSVQGLVEAIERYLQEPALRESHGDAARRRAQETYNWPATAQSLLKAYERAFEKRGKTII